MESGYYCAKAVIENFNDSQKILSAYKQNTTDLLAYMKRQWHLVSIMSSKFKYMEIKK
ncbi:MAG: hypothetical protein K2O86_06935 [Clostridia bacterium]|nr:hypothetical protein [Clostridia bacterium]